MDARNRLTASGLSGELQVAVREVLRVEHAARCLAQAARVDRVRTWLAGRQTSGRWRAHGCWHSLPRTVLEATETEQAADVLLGDGRLAVEGRRSSEVLVSLAHVQQKSL